MATSDARFACPGSVHPRRRVDWPYPADRHMGSPGGVCPTGMLGARSRACGFDASSQHQRPTVLRDGFCGAGLINADANRRQSASPEAGAESILIKDVEGTVAKIAELQKRGVRFALDDFGTGYSSLSYLRRLPLDQIKIDQSFVEAVPGDANACVLVKTIILLGNSLGFRVIAEGVETQAQKDFLATNGCGSYQGYLYGHPLPLEDFEASVRRMPGRTPTPKGLPSL